MKTESCLFVNSNSLNRLLLGKKKEIALEKDSTINIYFCGPTVYDYIHVGNLRPLITIDILLRCLDYLGFSINYVNNITDVDDKIIQRSIAEGISEKEIADYYFSHYKKMLKEFNIRTPNSLPRVVEHLNEIKDFISLLEKKGFTYKKNGDVYFSTEKVIDYGKISGQNLNKLKRVRETKKKENLNDFVLWKKTHEGIKWESPWSLGRPGWHTECVVLISKFFHQKTINIHGGGVDLIFPHHENERAQFWAAYSAEISTFWIHVSHVFWQEEKMSKSLGNVIYAKDFLKKYDSNALRHVFYSTHYRQNIYLNFSLLNQSVNYLKRIEILSKRISFFCFAYNLKNKDDGEKTNTIFRQDVIKRIFSDLETTKVLYLLEKLVKTINSTLDKKLKEEDFIISEKLIESFYNFEWTLRILGISFPLIEYDEIVKSWIEKWFFYRKKKEFILADEYRKKLQEKGIIS